MLIMFFLEFLDSPIMGKVGGVFFFWPPYYLLGMALWFLSGEWFGRGEMLYPLLSKSFLKKLPKVSHSPPSLEIFMFVNKYL